MCWHVPVVWRGIRAQLSERGSLQRVSAAAQTGPGFAGRTGLYCLCLFVCSVPVSRSASLLPVSIPALLIRPQPHISSPLCLSATAVCCAAWPHDCLWHRQVLWNAKLCCLQDISLHSSIQSLRLSEIPFRMGNHSLLSRGIFSQ